MASALLGADHPTIRSWSHSAGALSVLFIHSIISLFLPFPLQFHWPTACMALDLLFIHRQAFLVIADFPTRLQWLG